MKKNRGKSWLDKLDSAVANNSKLSLFILGQFLILTILVIGYTKMINKLEVIVELPKTMKEEGTIVVGKDFANKLFFRIWAREDVEMISEFDNKSIKEKMEYLRKRMYPPIYYKYHRTFQKFEKEIEKDLISQKFTFSKDDITVVANQKKQQAIVTIKGFYEKTIDEDKVLDGEKCEYQLGYIIKGGHIYVSAYKTTCN